VNGAATMRLLRRLAGACALAVAGLARAAGEPVVLTVPRMAEFETLDPMRAYDALSDQVLRSVYGTLLTYAYLERPYKLVPDLLAAMPAVSADGRTLSFVLRAGVRFADDPCFPGGRGRVVTSDDVLYSIRRFADGRVNDKTWFAMAGAVDGLDAYHAATLQAAPDADLGATPVAGLRKVDATRFTITLTHANPLFLYALAMTPTAIVPVEAVRFYKQGFGMHPVGSGPFRLEQPAARKGTLRLLKNPDYYGVYPSAGEPGDAAKGLLADAGRRLPLVDVLEMPLIEENQPAALKFLRGELDWRLLDRANFTKLVRRAPDGGFRVADEFAGRFGISYTSSPGIVYIVLNMKDAVLGANKALRQALAAAVDVPAEIDVLFNGRGRRLDSIVPYEFAGNERDTGAPPHVKDLARARRLLAEAGYPGGKGLPPLTISFYLTDADTHNLFDLLRAQFAAIGVQLKASYADLPTFTKATRAGSFQLAYVDWTADYPDAEDFYQLLYGRNFAPGPNIGSYADPAYDRAYEASRLMPDGPARLAYFRAMNQRVDDDAPVIGVLDSLRFAIHQRWVGNFKRNPLVQENMFLRVDMAAKKKGP
jgi:ABC-type transport system substrate-binding protein